MKNSLLIFLMLLVTLEVFAQQKITVLSNTKVTFSEKRGTYRWYKPVFAHEGSTLSADSADYNQGDNFFDAFGNVVITQPNGTVVYGDKLHYTESTQEAILTGKVRMIDRQATLSTDYLTYNMKSKRGTYVDGGQIINQRDTLTSKNGYYFENSQDAYFRYDVVVRTPDVIINTDTMRYNSNSKTAFFYGPTTIDGSNGRLYTENGDYNTESDKARFGKNNLYTEGSKFLWGDSLLYDGKTGDGRAVKNVNFVDTAQHIVMRGQLGTYNKATQTTLVTQNAYLVIATKSDSAKRDALAPLPQDSLNGDSSTGSPDSAKRDVAKMDSTYLSADTLLSRVIPLKDYQYTGITVSRSDGKIEINPPSAADSSQLQPDSISAGDLPAAPPGIQEDPAGAEQLKDSINALQTPASVPLEAAALAAGPKALFVPIRPAPPDGSIKGRPVNPFQLTDTTASRVSAVDSITHQATLSALNTGKSDSLRSDTAETRIVKAYHDVRIFKSDLQAIADSAYFGYPDSIIRCFGSPMIWSQGSQLSADTIYLQLKDQKLDNMLLQNKAFVVSTELDSSKYNQVKGKKISGFFKNDAMDRVFVDGNAESVYYTVEDNRYSGMARSISGRIKVLFQENKMTDVISIQQAATTYYPFSKIPADEEFLDGFIWKPELRPRSKEEVISRPPVVPAVQNQEEEDSISPEAPSEVTETETAQGTEESEEAKESEESELTSQPLSPGD